MATIGLYSSCVAFAWFCWFSLLLATPINARLQYRIVGGAVASRSRYPYFTRVDHDGDAKCGGVFIHDDIVLTAAHCAKSENISAVVNAYVSEGSHGDQINRSVESVTIHPNYDELTGSNDLAILKLSAPVNAVSPIPLNGAAPGVGQILTVIGVGDISYNGPVSEVLNEVSVFVIDSAICNSKGQYDGTVINGTMFCAGVTSGGKDSCLGDSGGPIIQVMNGIDTLVGIVSWGIGCADASYPGVYARITSARSWIDSTICHTTSVKKDGCIGISFTTAPVGTEANETFEPTPEPSPDRTELPTPEPTPTPTQTPEPTPEPSPDRTELPTPEPTPEPTQRPESTPMPSSEPTILPEEESRSEPTPEPTPEPSTETFPGRIELPSQMPTPEPTPEPTEPPKPKPTPEPSPDRTELPTPEPTPKPTQRPEPTPMPSSEPTILPEEESRSEPSLSPSLVPSVNVMSPIMAATEFPTKRPTKNPVRPSTKFPTKRPTKRPVRPPTQRPTRRSVRPTTKYPTKRPTTRLFRLPTKYFTKSTTKRPVRPPTKYPTKSPTENPYKPPTKYPTKSPTKNPVRPSTKYPTKAPTIHVTILMRA